LDGAQVSAPPEVEVEEKIESKSILCFIINAFGISVSASGLLFWRFHKIHVLYKYSNYVFGSQMFQVFETCIEYWFLL
jgi:hypothetical protein